MSAGLISWQSSMRAESGENFRSSLTELLVSSATLKVAPSRSAQYHATLNSDFTPCHPNCSPLAPSSLSVRPSGTANCFLTAVKSLFFKSWTPTNMDWSSICNEIKISCEFWKWLHLSFFYTFLTFGPEHVSGARASSRIWSAEQIFLVALFPAPVPTAHTMSWKHAQARPTMHLCIAYPHYFLSKIGCCDFRAQQVLSKGSWEIIQVYLQQMTMWYKKKYSIRYSILQLV